ncbi:MAG: hypothetical protein ACE5K2_01190 [Candidatus Zixiibacteriota bacterium]
MRMLVHMDVHSYENSRPYGQQQLITQRAGHLALPMGLLNSPFPSREGLATQKTTTPQTNELSLRHYENNQVKRQQYFKKYKAIAKTKKGRSANLPLFSRDLFETLKPNSCTFVPEEGTSPSGGISVI